MHFHLVTLFPELCAPYLEGSILGRAQKKGLFEIHYVNPRDFSDMPHKKVDDAPYGGGAGMVMMPEPLAQAIESIELHSPMTHKVYLSPGGRPFSQEIAKRYSQLPSLTLVCGRYEGVDQRFIDQKIDEEISLGDFILTGGEIAAMAVIDAVSRQLKGTLGAAESLLEESFSDLPLLEYPHYTRPPSWRGQDVPEVLLSGHHQHIDAWRQSERLRLTQEKRPELLRPSKNGNAKP